MFPLILVVLSAVPQDMTLRDEVEVIEVNHMYDGNGRLIFDQVMFWDLHRGEAHVTAWRLIKGQDTTLAQDLAGGKPEPPKPSTIRYSRLAPSRVQVVMADGGSIRVIGAKSIIETWTQFDPEIQDRAIFPQERRRGLLQEPFRFKITE